MEYIQMVMMIGSAWEIYQTWPVSQALANVLHPEPPSCFGSSSLVVAARRQSSVQWELTGHQDSL